MTEVGYTQTIKPVRDWSQRIWRLMFTQQVEIAQGRTSGVLADFAPPSNLCPPVKRI